jgi:heme/copper-type cytochrome/quinol oxidase subunit 3
MEKQMSDWNKVDASATNSCLKPSTPYQSILKPSAPYQSILQTPSTTNIATPEEEAKYMKTILILTVILVSVFVVGLFYQWSKYNG